MPEWIAALWLAIKPWVPLITVTGVVTLVGTALAVPWLLLKMPEDYFVRPRKPRLYRGVLGWIVFLLRNILATLLIIAGLIMLLFPGQGLLTILIGVMLSTYAGKYRMERAIIRRPSIFRTVNWIRTRYDRPPILYPEPWKAVQ